MGAGMDTLRIVVIAPDLQCSDPADDEAQRQAERSRSLRIGLLEAGLNLVASLPADVFLGQRLAQLQPDLVIVDAESDARDALEHVVLATRDAPRPIVMFTNDSEPADEAVAAGVSAYVVAGLAPERIRPILRVALARFEREQALLKTLAEVQNERDALSTELRERKLIDRAKGLLMQRHGVGEDEAYRRLRKTAMDKGLRLADVAQRLIDVADLLG
ncbi:MAG: ANTAR domain-containing protein [Rhodoferax sp.]